MHKLAILRSLKSRYRKRCSLLHYYPFGMVMPEREYNVGGYRYGFNGKENDNEVKGVLGSQQDYGMRIYDPRLGRFLSPDPLIVNEQEYPELSSYQFASNTPIQAIDLDGLESTIPKVTDLKTDSWGGSSGPPRGGGGAPRLSFFNTTRLRGNTVTPPRANVPGEVTKTTPTNKQTQLQVNKTQGAKAETQAGNQIKAENNSKNQNGDKETGSYTNSHQSGMDYHGKGTRDRMNESAKEKAEKYNDPVVSQDYTRAKNDREAFKQESKRLDKDKVGDIPGHKNPNNYNKRDSPGTKYRKQDGDD